MNDSKQNELEGHEHTPGGASHSHAPKDFGTAFAIGTTLNFGFVIPAA